MAEKLSESEVHSALTVLDDWSLSADHLSITKSFIFKDFNQAFGFITRIAMLSEKMNHHPDWRNSYKKVEITLTTHDVGGVSQLDIDMASKIESFC